MKKKLLSIVLALCLIESCIFGLSACEDELPPDFYGKTFVFNTFHVQYDSIYQDRPLEQVLEEVLAKIDWKKTIAANDSSIDASTFNETVTTMARLKEIFATFGVSSFGMKMTFATKEAATGTMYHDGESESFKIIDNTQEGTNASLQSMQGEYFAQVSLMYDSETNEIICLQFRPNAARDFTIYFTEEIMLLGSLSDFMAITAEIRFYPQAQE